MAEKLSIYQTFEAFDNKITVFRCETAENQITSQFAWNFVFKALKSIYGDNIDLTVKNGEKGKPYFKAYPEFHFNISHTENVIAVAFSKKDVGVDIEKLRSVNPKIARKFFTEDERAFVKNDKDFFYVWTRKEAYIKRNGRGFSCPLISFDILNRKDIKTFDLGEFTLSVCSESANDFVLENRL